MELEILESIYGEDIKGVAAHPPKLVVTVVAPLVSCVSLAWQRAHSFHFGMLYPLRFCSLCCVW